MGFLGNSDTNFKAPTSYYSSILSGNPASVAGALSPEISQLQSAYQQNRQAVDQFAPMGGGRASFMAQLPFQRASAVTNLISGARQNAAQGLTGIAGTQGALGSSLLGVGTQAAGAFGNQATTQNLADYLHSSATGSAISQLLLNALKGNNPLGSVLSKIPGLGGSIPTASPAGTLGTPTARTPPTFPTTGASSGGGRTPGPRTPSVDSTLTGYHDPTTGIDYDPNGNPINSDPFGNGGYNPYYKSPEDPYGGLPVGPSGFDPSSLYPPPVSYDPYPISAGGGPSYPDIPVGPSGYDPSSIWNGYDPYFNLNSGNPADADANYYNPYEFYKG